MQRARTSPLARGHSLTRGLAMLAAILMSLFLADGAWAAGRVALIVGVSKYDKVPALTNPAKDARLVEATLKKLGFTVTILSDPNRLELIEGLGNFEAQARTADAAVIYYAGHGAMIDGVNYLLPKDALATNKTALTSTAVESAKLGQVLAGAKVVRLVILDACRNNPVASRSIGGNTRGLVRETGPSSTQVVTLMAAGPGEVAQDGSGANSPFATALTQGMTRPGMTVGELPSYVQAEVARMTENEQTPDLQGIWPDVHWMFDAAGAPRVAAAGGAADLTKIKWEKDQVFWNTVKDSDDPADFRAYMDAQDRGEITGSFRKLAQNRLRTLEKSGPGSFQVATRSAQPGQTLVVSAREAFGRGDYRAAQRDWTAAAGQGNGAAMYNLGVMSLTGQGATKDIAAAAKWFKASADAGHSGGMVNWGLCRLNGFGTAKDEADGVRWIQQAADKGSAGAMGLLAEAYYRGRGVPADPRQAFSLYQRAALSGDSDAMVRLGYAYEDGQATAKDEVQAATWYQRAAEAGNSEGMSSLAVMLETGTGLPQDSTRAYSYYKAAADKGDARGYLGLGSMTARGLGVQANPAEAVRLFQAAADRGSGAAMHNLGILYETGQGVAANKAKALDYYRKAVAAGDDTARGELTRLGAR